MMNLNNKRHHHFLLFCKDLNKEPEELALHIESMRVNQHVFISGKKLILDKITETIHGNLYHLSLYANKIQRFSPVYLRKPPRRSIAQIQWVIMIIAIVLVSGAMVYSITIQQSDVLTYDVSCKITQMDLYVTGSSNAFLILSITNTGNQDIDVDFEIIDDTNTIINQNIGMISYGQTVQEKIPLNSAMTQGSAYMIQVTGTTASDTVDCSEKTTAK